MSNPELWKRKLAGFLHDPPDKCFDIFKHEDSARSFMAGAGFDDDETLRQYAGLVKFADHFASAADRFVFPKGNPQNPKCSTAYSGHEGASFIHPLSSTPYHIDDKVNLKEQHGHLHEILKDAVGSIKPDDPQTAFFLYWRRWLENAVTTEKQNAACLAMSPADSRIPDHSVWSHMAVTSAAAGCINDSNAFKPALLLFQIGPVQDFIAQARSTRDLWSGSYLLSWLMAHAMKAVSDEIGPDSIIFPSLRGNGIFDALHREKFYNQLFNGQPLWQRMLDEKQERAGKWLLTPTLPNRFLALVPADRAEALAKAAEQAIVNELQAIGGAVWQWIEQEAEKAGCSGTGNWQARWDAQIKVFPQITWAVQPWLEREECLAQFEKLPVNQERKDGTATPLERLQDMLDFGEKWLAPEDRDKRYYTDEDVNKPLNNPGILWSAHYALADAKLAARRNSRDFSAWNNPFPDSSIKDSLSGREEIIGDEKFWEYLQKQPDKLFKTKSHFYGAMNLIKRLWCRDDKVPYLREKLGLSKQDYGKGIGFDDTKEIAGQRGYLAIIAMDGDEMGKWVSGENAPEFLNQLSGNARKYLEPVLAKHNKTGIHRLLTPSYHLQFSEALSNFSTWLARPVVEKFGGQLIYSGGDDVLAMLPADQAIACAEALRSVFRGEEPREHAKFTLAVDQPGFVKENAGYPLIVPGAAADVSIGIAVGHCNAPLQMLVREAQKAEKHAKKAYSRGALALALYKRSGEIVEWGCKWDDGESKVAVELMRLITACSAGNNPPVSGKFPYALAQLLQPYQLKGAMSDMLEIILAEFGHVVGQQANGLSMEQKERLCLLAEKWLLQTSGKLEDFINLFLAETFINRFKGEN